MKKLLMFLMIALMSVMTSTPASAKTDMNIPVPTNIVVKQTTEFSDGRTLVIYYKKSGDVCEVYSPCRAKDYSVSDAVKIKKTTFEVVNKAEGKLYRKATVKEVKKIIKQLVNQYL